MASVTLTSELIESFAGAFLSPRYDNPQPTPAFHKECWSLYCQSLELCAVAAPREHAKSTALTHDFALAVALFRTQDYIVIVSATEDLAIGHLGDIAKELRENEDLIREFHIRRLVVDAKTDVIVEFTDGHQARFIAKGSGQKMRGLKWNGKRPGLILGDDLEEDEQVESLDRRRKFSRWFYRALLPCRRRGGIVRIHGTILHEDALLARMMKSKVWNTRRYKAHEGFDQFTNVLWPEQFPESRLRTIRQTFIEDGDPAGYSQEYLNDPRDNSEAFLRKGDFRPMKDADREKPQLLYVGCDFAVSKSDKANRTSFSIGGKDIDNRLLYRDQRVDWWDTLEWIDMMFEIQERWEPELFFVEDGVIWKAVAPILFNEMRARNKWFVCEAINPTRDKATRASALQKRMRAGSCLFDMEAEWFPSFQDELLRFTPGAEAALDDQFDSAAILAKGLELIGEVEEDDFLGEEEMEMIHLDPRKLVGRSAVTGY